MKRGEEEERTLLKKHRNPSEVQTTCCTVRNYRYSNTVSQPADWWRNFQGTVLRWFICLGLQFMTVE